MMSNSLFRAFTAVLAAAALTLTACAPAVGQNEAQESQSKKEEKKDEKKEDKKASVPQGTPVLWQEPTDISSRNLLLGPGGEEMKPDLKQVIWEETMPEGYSVKWRVRDAWISAWLAAGP